MDVDKRDTMRTVFWFVLYLLNLFVCSISVQYNFWIGAAPSAVLTVICAANFVRELGN